MRASMVVDDSVRPKMVDGPLLLKRILEGEDKLKPRKYQLLLQKIPGTW